MFSNIEGADGVEACDPCPEGSFCPAGGATAGTPCPEGEFYCPEGSAYATCKPGEAKKQVVGYWGPPGLILQRTFVDWTPCFSPLLP